MRNANEKAIVLGLDPGTLHIGYGIIAFTRRGFSHISHGTFSSAKKKPRLLEIEKQLSSLVSSFSPGYCAIERNYFGKNRISAMEVGEVRGVLRYCAEKHMLPLIELGPQEVKKRICGYGRAEKKAVSRMVSQLLGLREQVLSPDAADALALAVAAALEISGGLERLGLTNHT